MYSITSLYHKEMKKYIIIIVLAVLVVMFELYAFAQKLRPTRKPKELDWNKLKHELKKI